MSYKVKIKIKTDGDFSLIYEMPKFPHKFKSLWGKVSMTMYLSDDEYKAKTVLLDFIRGLSIRTHKEGLEETFKESVYKYSEELNELGLHSNHNLLSGNYEMEVFIFLEHSQYL